MIKDINEIKKQLKNCLEIELPYPFEYDVHIKYITVKDEEETFYTGGKFIRLLNDKIVLSNKGGDIIYKSRFFVDKHFNVEKDSEEVLELKSIIGSQQDIIDKMSKSLKFKSEENDKMKSILIRIKENR